MTKDKLQLLRDKASKDEFMPCDAVRKMLEHIDALEGELNGERKDKADQVAIEMIASYNEWKHKHVILLALSEIP